MRIFGKGKSTNQSGKRNERLPDLCFAICRFSRVVFILRAQPHAQSLFLFPIVFGINLIHFFYGKNNIAPLERVGTKRAKFLATESENSLRISAPQYNLRRVRWKV